MIIDVSSSKETKGFKNYLINGTKDKPRDHSKVRHMEGNFDLGEDLKGTIDRQRKSYNFVISLHHNDNINSNTMDAIHKDFIDELLIGMNREDVLVNSCEHTDTEHRHFHTEVIDSHLLTGQGLRLYSHKEDLERFDLIRDKLELKYGLTRTKEHIPNFTINTDKYKKTEKTIERINKWREEHKISELDSSMLKMKSGQDKAITHEMIISMLKEELFKIDTNVESVDDIKNLLNGLSDEFNVVKVGKNLKSDYHYMTIENNYGDKVKLESDIFNPKFYELSSIERTQSLISNESLISKRPPLSMDEIDKRLDVLREQRKGKVFKSIKKHTDPELIYHFETNKDKYIDGRNNKIKNKKFKDIHLQDDKPLFAESMETEQFRERISTYKQTSDFYEAIRLEKDKWSGKNTRTLDVLEVDIDKAAEINLTKGYELLHLYKGEEVKQEHGYYMILDKDGSKNYLLEHENEHLLYNHDKKEVKSLMSFVKSEEKFTNLMTFSYFESELKIDRVINLNKEAFTNELKHILSTMTSVGDIYSMNNELESRYGDFVKIRLDHNFKYLYLNDLQMEFDITSLKDDFESNKGKELDSLMDSALVSLENTRDYLNQKTAKELISKALKAKKDKKEEVSEEAIEDKKVPEDESSTAKTKSNKSRQRRGRG